MSAAQNPQVQLLLGKSAEDEVTLTLAVPDAIFEFHTQQAIEKLLKALIAAYKQQFLFVHDLQVLSQQLQDLGETLPNFEIPLEDFTKFGVTVRYDEVAPLKDGTRERFRSVVSAVRTHVTKRIEELP